MDNDINNDYKKLWELLQKELREMGERAKQDAIRQFEHDNANNFNPPIQTEFFTEQMATMRTTQNILNMITQIEIGELLFFKHEEKCKKHNEEIPVPK